MIDCISSEMVPEPAIVIDGDHCTIVLPEAFSELAETLDKLLSGCKISGTVRAAKQGAA